MKHLFGPVPSRRLGMSLGIDLVPHKVCTLDCVYCECGATTDLTVERKEYVQYDEVIEELQEFFANNPDPDYFTFSGSGEPTLNSRIGDVLKFVKKEKPDIPVAVLTNGSLLYLKNLREELLTADLIIPSLDAAIDNSFQRINAPHPNLNIDLYIKGLQDFRKEYNGKMWLEVFILPGYSDSIENLSKLKEALNNIQPDKIQLNTLDRPGNITDIKRAERNELIKIMNYFNLPNVEIISAADNKNNKIKPSIKDMNSIILNTISRRPCTSEDLAKLLNCRITEVGKYLRILEKEKKIESISLKRGIFYKKTEKLL